MYAVKFINIICCALLTVATVKALPTMCTYYIIVNYFVIPDDLRTIFRLNEVNRQWSQTWSISSSC